MTDTDMLYMAGLQKQLDNTHEENRVLMKEADRLIKEKGKLMSQNEELKQLLRDFLESHFYASKKITALEAERRQLRMNAAGGAVSYEGNYTTPHPSSTERILMRLADEEEAIDEQIVQLREQQHKVRVLISELHDNDLEAVLIYRYILHHTVEDTAGLLHYAVRTVQVKQKKAIRKLCTLLHCFAPSDDV